MIFEKQVYKYMFAALQEAEIAMDYDEIPIGAVIVNEGKIIGKGYNQVERLQDPTAHAEMIAITAATNQLQSKILKNCDLYVTVEPCIMCVGAILLARIKTIYFGTFEPKFGACGSIHNLIEKSNYNHTPIIYSGIYEKESKELLKKFFQVKRKVEDNKSID
jgi:tRNA(adenine34) deaminase